MAESELFREVVRAVGEYLRADTTGIRPDSLLAAAIPGLDSMRLFEVLLHLEDRFGIKFPDTVMGNLRTAGQLIDCVAEQLAAKATAAGPTPHKAGGADV